MNVKEDNEITIMKSCRTTKKLPSKFGAGVIIFCQKRNKHPLIFVCPIHVIVNETFNVFIAFELESMIMTLHKSVFFSVFVIIAHTMGRGSTRNK